VERARGDSPGRRFGSGIAERRTSQEVASDSAQAVASAPGPTPPGEVECPSADSDDPDRAECLAMNPPPTDPVRVLFCVLWAAWAIGLSVFLAIYFFRMAGSGLDTSVVASGVLTNFVEGIFFLFRSAYYVTRVPSYMFPYGLAIQFFSGVGLWFTAIAMFFYGRGWNKELVWTILFSIGGTLSVSYTIFLLKGYFLVGQALFVPWFEIAQVFLLSNVIAIRGTAKGEGAVAACQFLSGFSLMFGVHIIGMGLNATGHEDFEKVFFPFQIICQMIGSLTTTLALIKMTELGMFNDRSHEQIQYPPGLLATLHAEREARDAHKVGVTAVVSPEGIWSIGVVFVLLGYGLSTLMLFTVAIPRKRAEGIDLMEVDPVLRLYGTLHPCILLDYLPGTLFAQPLFDLSVLISQVSAAVSLVRAALFGDVFILGIFAFMFGVYMPLSCLFQLVFTFNPTYTSVLLHSIPYILDNISKGWYCFCTAYAVWQWPELVFREQVHCTFAAGFYILAIVYGTFFMSSKLMSNAGLGCDGLDPSMIFANSTVLGACPANEVLKVKVDPFPLIMTLFAQGLLFSLGLVSPLKNRPLAFEVRCWESGIPADLSADPHGALAIQETQQQERRFFTSATGGNGHGLRLLAKRPLLFAMLVLAFSMYSAKWLAEKVYGEQVDDWDYRDKFITQPSASIVAVGWIVVLQFLAANVALVVTSEYRNNYDGFVRWVVYISGLLLLCTGVTAHAGTIPHAPAWFHGPEAFLVALALWILKDVLLLQQLLDRARTSLLQSGGHVLVTMVWLEMGLAVLAGVSVLAAAFSRIVAWSLGSGFKMPDYGWMALVVLYSLFDVRRVQVILSNVRCADQVDLLGTRFFRGWTEDLKEAYETVPVQEVERDISAGHTEYLKDHVERLPEAAGAGPRRAAGYAGYAAVPHLSAPGPRPQQLSPGGILPAPRAPESSLVC